MRLEITDEGGDLCTATRGEHSITVPKWMVEFLHAGFHSNTETMGQLWDEHINTKEGLAQLIEFLALATDLTVDQMCNWFEVNFLRRVPTSMTVH